MQKPRSRVLETGARDGGDGGESNSPSSESASEIYYARRRCFGFTGRTAIASVPVGVALWSFACPRGRQARGILTRCRLLPHR